MMFLSQVALAVSRWFVSRVAFIYSCF